MFDNHGAPFITIDDKDAFNSSTPTIAGKAKPGSTIIIEAGEVTLATFTDVDGRWAVILPDRYLWTEGLHTLTVTATDADGKIFTTSCRLDTER